MADAVVNIRFKAGLFPVRPFPSRATNWAVTESWGNAPYMSLTHVHTGYRLGDGLEPRTAEMLAVVFDRILPGKTVEEVMAAFMALPENVRIWILSVRRGWA